MLRWSLATRLFGSLRSPKTIACVGHAWPHAGTIAPSGIDQVGENSTPPCCAHWFLKAIFACEIRCVQKVHFSITPRVRTVTSGLYCIFVQSFGPSLV